MRVVREEVRITGRERGEKGREEEGEAGGERWGEKGYLQYFYSGLPTVF